MNQTEPTSRRTMRTVSIVQARMSSTRLPGKVLMPLAGREVLGHVVDRLRHCRTLDQIVVATSDHPSDAVLHDWCVAQSILVFRGSLDDVLDRYYQCARHHHAEAVVRITADCPAVDPTVVDEVVKGFLAGPYDLFYLGGDFPDGLDCAVFSMAALERAWREANLKSEREHVGPHVLNHPELFRVGSLERFKGLAQHRWTLDDPRDLAFLQAVFQRLYHPECQPFTTQELLDLLAREPDLFAINQGIVRNEGLLKSLAADADIR